MFTCALLDSSLSFTTHRSACFSVNMGYGFDPYRQAERPGTPGGGLMKCWLWAARQASTCMFLLCTHRSHLDSRAKIVLQKAYF